jgi:hypothetical protein
MTGELHGSATDDISGREESHDRPGQNRLSRTGLTNYAKRLSPADGE